MAKIVKCNFKELFAKINEIDELKSIAQSIVNQAKEAYDSRYRELSETDDYAVAIESTESTQDEQVAEKPKKSVKGKKSVTSAAKEMAEQMKKETKTKKAKAEKKAEPKTKKAKADDTEETISVTDKAAIKKLGLKFEKYNDKCWVLRGETKPLKDYLKQEFKGVFNSHLEGGGGWVIRTAVAQDCAKALGLKVKVA